MNSISQNIEKLRKDIKDVCNKIGRNSDEIKLVAVSKTKPIEDIEGAFAAGITDFGENYIQEAFEKYESLNKNAKLHFIGSVQTNKVKYLTKFCYLLHSLDRESLAKEIDKRLKLENKTMDCLIQVNTSGEVTKSGIAPEKAFELAEIISQKYSNIKIKGLMTIAENSDSENSIRENFMELKNIFNQLKNLNLPNIEMKELSMGMSSDYKIAIEEGATILRVGSLIFGERTSRTSFKT